MVNYWKISSNTVSLNKFIQKPFNLLIHFIYQHLSMTKIFNLSKFYYCIILICKFNTIKFSNLI